MRLTDITSWEIENAEILEGLSKRLRTARLMQDATLEDIFRDSGCSKSMLSRVESGKQSIALLTLVHVAAALNVDVSWLLEGDVDDRSRIGHLRSKLRKSLPRCTAEILAGLPTSFGRTSSSISNVDIIGQQVIGMIGRSGRPAACLVLNGVLGISSKISSAQVKAGSFFQVSETEAFRYRNASKANVSMVVASM